MGEDLKIKYTFNFRMQLIYGMIGILSTLIIIFIFTQDFNWLLAMVVGVGNFITSGLYDLEKTR